MKRKRAFTPAEDAALLACWKAEASSEEIRAAFPDRLFATVVGRAHTLGLPKRSFRPKRSAYRVAERHPPMSDANGQIGLGDEDRRYVDRCRALGGFPLLEEVNGQWFTVWPHERAA